MPRRYRDDTGPGVKANSRAAIARDSGHHWDLCAPLSGPANTCAIGVPTARRPPVARLVHELVPEGDVILEDLYNAVAEALAYVYRPTNREV